MRHSFLFLFLIFGISNAWGIEVTAPQAYMVDFDTGEVLFEKNADQRMVPSSMTKIMTAYIVFDRLKSGDIQRDQTLSVSKEAWQMGGSKMFVKVGTEVGIDDLLKGVIVQSGNDACVVLAEGLSGSEVAFAEEMTKRARDFGATQTTFLNATGWPDDDHLTTAKDLALISEKLIRDFPDEYKRYFALTEYSYNNIKQGNRNTLLYKNMGADGIKTGRTDAGGSGIVGSAKVGDRRLIVVVNGLPSAKVRDQEATALLKWGFSHFKNYKLFETGKPVDVVDVWGGAEKVVPLVVGSDVILTLTRDQRKDVQAKLVYNSPLSAPLKAGTEVGFIEVTSPKGVQNVPLLVGKNVQQADFFKRISNSIRYLIWGRNSS